MNYQGRVREIQSAFVMGYHDRETCIRMFEELLHDYALLPKEEQLDRTITNENFLTLLRMAKDHKTLKKWEADTHQQAASKLPPTGIVDATTAAQYRIADSVRQRCPVCEKSINALFNRVQSLDQQVIPVDPPRCQECMIKWVEEKFGLSRNSKVPPPAFADRSPASPMKSDETDFFALYEKQMGEEE